MSVSIADIVRQAIRHARQMSNGGLHDWPTAREALTKILADLEAQSPDDPSLARLRAFIALGDRAFSGEKDEPKCR
jgi:hypothetical protein